MQACNIVQSDATINGSPAVRTHPSHHQQQHSTWPHNGHYDFKILQVQRHEVPVVEVLQSAEAVCIPMCTWSKESCRIPKQAPSRDSPPTCPPKLCSRQNSFITVNWTVLNVFVHISGDIIHSIMCDLFTLFYYFFPSLSQIFSNGFVIHIYLKGCADMPI